MEIRFWLIIVIRARANALNLPPGTTVARLKLKEIDEVRTSGEHVFNSMIREESLQSLTWSRCYFKFI